ncbi:hypothetical protein PAESOLCIP111_03994 [Paenibacillus solanacearum]|uniref:Uncharacterized protein n=1 Tax=Paenibacillus solanacearum TaxID=2048548 RepID=A0A916NR99_9BACL|nr:hypothetical protein PAESOLCIP111_03994 [Paenibacillus solanacearum]
MNVVMRQSCILLTFGRCKSAIGLLRHKKNSPEYGL